MTELARSATDGDREGSLDVLRTEKKVDDGRFCSPSAPVELDNFSSALMRCEMLDPILELLGLASDEGCCVILCRYAAPDERALAELDVTSPGARKLPRTGFETVRVMARGIPNSPSRPSVAARLGVAEPGNTDDMGDLETTTGCASSTVAD